jgi:hypothetical protein
MTFIQSRCVHYEDKQKVELAVGSSSAYLFIQALFQKLLSAVQAIYSGYVPRVPTR